jgi:hypothetical protein
MEPNYPGGRRQRTPEEIIKLLEEYENSEGITVKEYCAMIGVSDAAFYNWRKMYGPKNENDEKQGSFIELVPSEDMPVQRLFAEVRGIKLYQPVNAEFLKALAL